MKKTEVYNAITNNEICVLDFWASWCGPCTHMKDVIEKLEKEFSNINFIKINVDENRDICLKFQISTVPTLIIFKNGEIVDTITGFHNFNELSAIIEKIVE